MGTVPVPRIKMRDEDNIKPKIVLIVGPTAVGKSRVAMALADIFYGEVVSADSMQVYRYMDIGTAKPSRDDLEKVHHYLIDIRNPDEDFDAAQFREEASNAITEIVGRRMVPIVSGGTGLYIRTLTEGIFEAPKVDKELREKLRKEGEELGISALYKKLVDVDPAARGIDPLNPHRIIRALEVFYLTGRSISEYHREHAFSERPFISLKIGLMKDREALYRDIDKRVDCMIKAGFIDEVVGIIKMGYSSDLKSMNSIGYSHICNYLKGRYSLEEATVTMSRETRHYAKRQMTWFKRDNDITWFDVNEGDYLERIFCKVRGFVG